MPENLAVAASNLCKQYGNNPPALNNFSLSIPYGTVHGLLGPNGAGKSTAVRILTTLLRADSGRATVAGADVFADPQGVRRRIGLVGQHAAVDDILSGRENLVLFGKLFHLSNSQARNRADELLEQFLLSDSADRPVATYSGGMRRRLDLAASLIMSPRVLFLDEPTTGLDPRGRNEVWEAVRSLIAHGTTVLLTTQYLEEADQLATTITVINHGATIAEGTPDTLKARIGGDRIEVVARNVGDLTRLYEVVQRVTGATSELDPVQRKVSGPIHDSKRALIDVFGAITTEGIEIEDLTVRRPTLDEVFLHLTGTHVREEHAA